MVIICFLVFFSLNFFNYVHYFDSNFLVLNFKPYFGYFYYFWCDISNSKYFSDNYHFDFSNIIFFRCYKVYLYFYVSHYLNNVHFYQINSNYIIYYRWYVNFFNSVV